MSKNNNNNQQQQQKRKKNKSNPVRHACSLQIVRGLCCIVRSACCCACNIRQRTVSLLCPCVTTQYGQPFLVVLTKSRLSVLTLLACLQPYLLCQTCSIRWKKKFSSHVREECLAYPTRLRPNGRLICLIDSRLLVFFSSLVSLHCWFQRLFCLRSLYME